MKERVIAGKKGTEIGLTEALTRTVESPDTVAAYMLTEVSAKDYTIAELMDATESGSLMFLAFDSEAAADAEKEDEVKEEPQQEPAAADAAPQEEEMMIRRGGRKPVDDGMIKALYDADWKPSDIAKDMGLSVPTIKTHLRRMGLLGPVVKDDDDAEENG